MLLELEKVSVKRGRLTAVHEISFSIEPGSVVGLTGLNGAGKTSLLLAIAGAIPIENGTVRYQGSDITDAGAGKCISEGVVLVPEGRRLFGPMSIEDNLLIGGQGRGSQACKESLEEVYELFPLLSDRRRENAENLSGGQQQLLALARGLMAVPTVLLLDEPTLGLSPKVIDAVFDAIREIQKQRTVSMLVAEQNVGIATEICEWLHVIENGRLVADGPSSEFTPESLTQQALEGGEHDFSASSVNQ